MLEYSPPTRQEGGAGCEAGHWRKGGQNRNKGRIVKGIRKGLPKEECEAYRKPSKDLEDRKRIVLGRGQWVGKVTLAVEQRTKRVAKTELTVT